MKTIDGISVSTTMNIHIVHLWGCFEILLIINIINIRSLSMTIIYSINIFGIILIFPLRWLSSLFSFKAVATGLNHIALFRFISRTRKTREPSSTRLLSLHLILLQFLLLRISLILKSTILFKLLLMSVNGIHPHLLSKYFKNISDVSS